MKICEQSNEYVYAIRIVVFSYNFDSTVVFKWHRASIVFCLMRAETANKKWNAIFRRTRRNESSRYEQKWLSKSWIVYLKKKNNKKKNTWNNRESREKQKRHKLLRLLHTVNNLKSFHKSWRDPIPCNWNKSSRVLKPTRRSVLVRNGSHRL